MSRNKAPRWRPSDILLSIDGEFDGPIPGPYSMMALGAVAFTLEGEILGSWTANFRPLEGARTHPDFDEFWRKNPEAFAATQVDPRDPAEATWEYRRFIEALPHRPVVVGYPVSADFLWHHWYLHKFTGDDPTGFAAFDLKSYGAALLGSSFRGCSKRNFPKDWFAGGPKHNHIALDDALGQAYIALNMIRQHTPSLVPPAEAK